MAIVRVNKNGVYDEHFGQVTLNVLPPRLFSTRQDDSLIIVGPYSVITYSQPPSYPIYQYLGQYVVKLKANGQRDTQFGNNGFDIASSTPNGSVAIDPSGNLVFGGTAFGKEDLDFSITRYREFTPTHSVNLPITGFNTWMFVNP